MTVASNPEPASEGLPVGLEPPWRLSLDRRGLEVRAGRHLTAVASPALLMWLTTLGSGVAGARWLL